MIIEGPHGQAVVIYGLENKRPRLLIVVPRSPRSESQAISEL